MEIISGVERRRRWRIEDKLRILAEIDGGATLTDVARRHDVSRGLLWQWRDAQRRGRLTAERATFVPVRLVPRCGRARRDAARRGRGGPEVGTARVATLDGGGAVRAVPAREARRVERWGPGAALADPHRAPENPWKTGPKPASPPGRWER